MKIQRRNFLKTVTLAAASIATAKELKAVPKANKKGIPLKKLGATGAHIPILQIGTAQSLDSEYDRILHRCYREGVTALDTALSYGWGSSHRAIKTFLKQVNDRKNLWITSKSGSGFPKGLVEDLDEALTDLRTNYLDLFLMHGINDEDYLGGEFLKAGEKMKKSGKTRLFGFSCHGSQVANLMNKAAKTGGIDAILFRYNFRRYGDKELNRAIDACNKAGIGLIAMKVMDAIPEEDEKVVGFRSKRFTLGQAKLKSVWADERIDSIVSEMDSLRYVKENVKAAKSSESLTAEEQHQLNRLAALTSHLSCQGCSHFCENGLEKPLAIADSLRFLMYAESYHKSEKARELYQAIPLEQREWHPALLAKAAKSCPQGIDLQARLVKAEKILA